MQVMFPLDQLVLFSTKTFNLRTSSIHIKNYAIAYDLTRAGTGLYNDLLWAGRPGFGSWQEQDFFVIHSVQTCSGIHPTSYPVGTAGDFLEAKAVEA
jgi:hypothetical protein